MSLLTGFVNVCNCLGAGAGYLIVCGQVFEVLSGLRLAALSHLAPLRVQGEGGCEMSEAILAQVDLCLALQQRSPKGLQVAPKLLLRQAQVGVPSVQKRVVSHKYIAISSSHGSGALQLSVTSKRSTTLPR